MKEFGREFKILERFLGKNINLKYLPVYIIMNWQHKEKYEDIEHYASKKIKWLICVWKRQMFTQESTYNMLIKSPVNISMKLVLKLPIIDLTIKMIGEENMVSFKREKLLFI